ncbi:hypothetical protein LXG23DRAFT_23391 [Yarrowia lipolytica]|uniref:Uncharacterized protein n=1 Tax=Yarrowia lipolytica TaxID=4952 RepID=A0A1D8NAG9_YARLL|nr:hypothetical protein YALI1_C14125g [Yarrowia lipolytica]KAB8283222.1 hypothetical protein BKA91DRAFT_151988 [Yarrowia lipolytica]KAE8169563.1 hypothetical protein BKA90DRAFT_149279 [Yarrowia lipolytica]KAJ8053285.1 hypothetical protein LXG23DRAFT_23391 [Yarrowia lipolytica]RMI94348.1 hypothetical protein BD777DRAFT_144112 [Yarrowia lipolytica]
MLPRFDFCPKIPHIVVLLLALSAMASSAKIASPFVDFAVQPLQGQMWDLYTAHFLLDTTGGVSVGDFFVFSLESDNELFTQSYDTTIWSGDVQVGRLSSDEAWNFRFDFAEYVERHPDAKISFSIEFYLAELAPKSVSKCQLEGKNIFNKYTSPFVDKISQSQLNPNSVKLKLKDETKEFQATLLVEKLQDTDMKMVRTARGVLYTQTIMFHKNQRHFELFLRTSPGQSWVDFSSPFDSLYFVDNDGNVVDSAITARPRVSASRIHLKIVIPYMDGVAGIFFAATTRLGLEPGVVHICATVAAQGEAATRCQSLGSGPDGVPGAQGWVVGGESLDDAENPFQRRNRQFKRDIKIGDSSDSGRNPSNGNNNGQGNAPGGYYGHNNGLGNGHHNGNNDGNNNGNIDNEAATGWRELASVTRPGPWVIGPGDSVATTASYSPGSPTLGGSGSGWGLNPVPTQPAPKPIPPLPRTPLLKTTVPSLASAPVWVTSPVLASSPVTDIPQANLAGSLRVAVITLSLLVFLGLILVF